MIFCNQYYLGAHRHTLHLDAAREYAANLFNWLAACRDYSYAQHAEPSAPPYLHICAWMEIRERVIREWTRSNAR